jgi:hypothetical protein
MSGSIAPQTQARDECDTAMSTVKASTRTDKKLWRGILKPPVDIHYEYRTDARDLANAKT